MKFTLNNGEDTLSSSSFLSNKAKNKIAEKATKDIGKNTCCPSLTIK